MRARHLRMRGRRRATVMCVLILLYMCPHTTIYVSSYYCMCVFMKNVGENGSESDYGSGKEDSLLTYADVR
jgi:hypothetical protein